MSRNYDNWERLVEAVLDREKLRQLAREPSFDSITSDFSSCFSFDSTLHPEYVPETPKPFSYDELKKATRNFQVFAEGGSRYDFKGWIDEHTLTSVKPGSGLAITVKSIPEGLLLDNHKWMSKVKNLGQLRHPNLVKLIGYCTEAYRWFLVYEFMPKGSLEMNLLKYDFMPRRRDSKMDSSGSNLLNQTPSWETRVNVAIDVARALCFLHDRKPPVTHMHVKASMILLDENFNAKLDVFLNKLDPRAHYAKMKSSVNIPHPNLQFNLLRDSNRYWPPEYASTGGVTAKTDVYSFGIVLLQLLSWRLVFDRQRIPSEQNLVDWAKPYLSDKRKLFSIMDPELRNQYSNVGASTLATIALQCLNRDPELRPSMTKVIAALEQQLKRSSGTEF